MNRTLPPEPRAWLGTLPAAIFLLAGGLLGFIEPATVTGQGLAFTEDPTRLMIYGGSYAWSLCWLMLHPSGLQRLIRGSWPWCGMLGYVLASALWSPYPLKVIINFGHLAGGTLIAAAAVLSVNGSAPRLARLVMLSLGVIVILSLAAVMAGLPSAFDPESRRWAGTTGNANTLGLVSALTCWASTYLALTTRTVGMRTLAVVALAVSLATLLGSGSATSLVAMLLMCAGMCWLLVGGAQQSGVTLRICIAAAASGLAIVCVLAFAPGMLSFETGLHALGRSSTLTGRTELWDFGWDQFMRKPIAGHGFDSLASVLSRASMQVGQLHNGYLDLLVQGGTIAGTLFLVLVIRAWCRALVLAHVRRQVGVMCLVLIVGVLAHNVTESSIARPVSSLWFLFVIAMLTVEWHRDRSLSVPRIQAHAYSHHHPARAASLPNLLR